MVRDHPIIKDAIVINVEKRTLDINVKQRIAMYVIEHPSLLRVYLKTRQSRMEYLARMNGMVAVVRNVRRLSKSIGVDKKPNSGHSP